MIDLHQGEERCREMPLDATLMPMVLVDQNHLGSSIRLYPMLDIPLKEGDPSSHFKAHLRRKAGVPSHNEGHQDCSETLDEG